MKTCAPLCTAIVALATAHGAPAQNSGQTAGPVHRPGTVLVPRNGTSPAQPVAPSIQPATPVVPATLPGLDATTSVAKKSMTCRGNARLHWEDFVEVSAPFRSMTNIYVQNATGPIDARGRGLEIGQCALEGTTGYFAPRIAFPRDWDARAYLFANDHYMVFDVLPTHGGYEAVASRRIEPLGGTTIETGNTGQTGQTASSLERDCERQGPRLNQTQRRVTAGQPFKLVGACFGGGGQVDVQGSLPDAGRIVTILPTRWTKDGIEARMPAIGGVLDQRVTIIVTRADGRKSTGVEVPFVAMRERKPVPADRWTPTANPSDVSSDVVKWSRIPGNGGPLVAPDADDDPPIRDHRVTAHVRVNPACALEAPSYQLPGGHVTRQRDWTGGPAVHEGSVTLVGRPRCVVTQSTILVSGERKRECTFAPVLTVQASCPVGVDP